MASKIPFSSAFDIADEIFRKLCEAVQNEGGNGEDLRELARDNKRLQQFAKLVVGEGEGGVFTLPVNYDLPLAEAIRLGGYDWVNDCIRNDRRLDKPKFSGTHERKFKLVYPKRFISTEGVEEEIKRQGGRPASIEELLAFGAKFPELQRKFPIVGLGSRFRGVYGSEFVPSLNRRDRVRGLYLLWVYSDWGAHGRFLSVCES